MKVKKKNEFVKSLIVFSYKLFILSISFSILFFTIIIFSIISLNSFVDDSIVKLCFSNESISFNSNILCPL